MRFPRVRFTVRRLMAVILALCCGLGWVVHRAHVQRDAVAAIKRAGGYVRYDWMFPNDRYDPNATAPAPKWLIDLIGVDYFGNVVWVVFRPGSGGSDTELAEVASFDKLGVLVLHSSQVTDSGLNHIKGLRKVGSICLKNSKVSDAGLSRLENMGELQSLNFENTDISDNGLIHLKRMRNLGDLSLENTAISDAGIQHLIALSRLTDLNVRGTKVTDAGLAPLRRANPHLRITR